MQKKSLWLAIVLTCLGIIAVWNCPPVRQKRAFSALLEQYGASVSFDTQHRSWILRRVVNSKFIARVYLVDLSVHRILGGRLMTRPQTVDSQVPRMVKYLQDLPQLESLILTDTAITDVGAEYLARLKHVRELDLSGTGVTDACVPLLAKMDGLKTVDLTKTKVTAAGLRRFQELRPDTRVEEMNWGTPPRGGTIQRIH